MQLQIKLEAFRPVHVLLLIQGWELHGFEYWHTDPMYAFGQRHEVKYGVPPFKHEAILAVIKIKMN